MGGLKEYFYIYGTHTGSESRLCLCRQVVEFCQGTGIMHEMLDHPMPFSRFYLINYFYEKVKW
jgi:hypothetical protein